MNFLLIVDEKKNSGLNLNKFISFLLVYSCDKLECLCYWQLLSAKSNNVGRAEHTMLKYLLIKARLLAIQAVLK